jgi:hypothetical protein
LQRVLPGTEALPVREAVALLAELLAFFKQPVAGLGFLSRSALFHRFKITGLAKFTKSFCRSYRSYFTELTSGVNS